MREVTSRVREARARLAADDAGFGLVEVVASMLIFALLSVGLLHTLLNVLSMSRDARARQVATNLAAETVDRARDKDNLFDVLDDTHTVDLNGDEFTVSMTSQWVSDPSVSLQCGAGGGVLRYKRINVEVTWTNMRPSTQPVRSDTVINPDSRINDPTKGTILVSVLDGEGLGSGGVAVSANALSGGGSVPSTATDAQGCAYMLMVEPGDYRIRVQRTGYVDVNQQADATTDVTVSAGGTASASFQYDLAAAYTVALAPGQPSLEISNDMELSLVSTYGTSVQAGTTSRNRTFDLHPFASGYTGFAGTCAAADPATWPQGTSGSDTLVGIRPPAVAAEPGASATLDLPTGVVRVSVPSNRYLTAVAVDDPDNEHLGCATAARLDFGRASGTRTVALPYGSWELYYGNSSGSTSTKIAAPAVLTTGEVQGSVVTLDPRVVEVTP
ncbi:type II secretion system protein [Cellulomonas sp. APG4]|uniref:type II secretion system protein n=1 Tax=Cellulomonas sp. APG4 TaxID=1538656 RepID=UPI00137B21E4|nr:type II secretion system protein [Cellulomonas sp. APG4]NCT90868.1 type II secretion system protein [Cellulomonas sp. APG4]